LLHLEQFPSNPFTTILSKRWNRTSRAPTTKAVAKSKVSVLASSTMLKVPLPTITLSAITFLTRRLASLSCSTVKVFLTRAFQLGCPINRRPNFCNTYTTNTMVSYSCPVSSPTRYSPIWSVTPRHSSRCCSSHCQQKQA